MTNTDHSTASGAEDRVVVERDISGETVCGFRVAAYRETHPEHGDKYGHAYSEHWSTPNTRDPAVKVERMFTETQLLAALAQTPDRAVAVREAVTAEAIARASDPLWWAWWDKGSDADREWAWRHHKNEIERGEKLLVSLRPFFANTSVPSISEVDVDRAKCVLESKLNGVWSWPTSISEGDLSEIVADGGVTAGMVVQQEARNVQAPKVQEIIDQINRFPQIGKPTPTISGEGEKPSCGVCKDHRRIIMAPSTTQLGGEVPCPNCGKDGTWFTTPTTTTKTGNGYADCGEGEKLRAYYKAVEEMVCVWRDTNTPSSMDEEAWEDPSEDDDRWAKFIAARAALATPDAAPIKLPADVRALVIAGREFWDENNDTSPESNALDKALEAFSSRVPYENEPDDSAAPIPTPAPVIGAGEAGTWHD